MTAVGATTLLHLLAANATARRDEPALLSLDATPLSHVELHALVTRTVDSLREAGLSADDTVIVSMRYGPSAVAVSLAVAAGCAAAPRDVEMSPRELAVTFDLLRPSAVVIDDRAGAAAVAAADRGLAILEVVDQPGLTGSFDLEVIAPARHRSQATMSGDRGNAVAVVLETSGTSGRPKQVPLTHANLLAGARAMRDVLGISADDRTVHLASMFTIAGYSAPLLVPLLTGGSTIVAGPFDADRFMRAAALGATWWNAGPTVQRALSQAVVSDRDRWTTCAEMLRLTRCSGAVLSAEAWEELEAAYGLPVVHAYGMTETVSQVTSNSPTPGGSRHGTAGRPMENEVRVVTEAGQVAPRGTAGEIQVRGASVCARYIGDPELDRAFVDGWFCTGDVGHFDDDGYLTVMGRRGEIINRGGALVSPAEVDFVATAHPGVSDAATFAVPHATLGQEVGLAVVTPGEPPADLHAFLAARLAPRKRPRFVQAVDAIPRTATGKVRRGELADHVVALRRLAPSSRPQGHVEERIATLWREVTGAPPDGRDDDFFLAGGDSLRAISLLAAIEETFGLAIGITDFLESPTVAGLAATVRNKKNVSRAAVHIRWPGTGAMPVVMFAGVDGAAISVAALADRVDRSHLVAIPDAPGLHEGRHPRTIEQLAAHHLDELAPILGDGPCVLVGYSFGCIVAVEVARQREAAGRQTALVLVDRAPAGARRMRWRGRLLLRSKGVVRELTRAGDRNSRRRARVRVVRTRARNRYRGGRFSGPTWVLVTQRREARYGHDLGWAEELGRPVDVVPIPGTHRMIGREPAAKLAIARVVEAAAHERLADASPRA